MERITQTAHRNPVKKTPPIKKKEKKKGDFYCHEMKLEMKLDRKHAGQRKSMMNKHADYHWVHYSLCQV